MTGNVFGEFDDLLRSARDRLRIAVIYGGDNREADAVLAPGRNPRPWKSYAQVAEDIAATLREAGFAVPLVCADDLRLVARLRVADINFAWLNTAGVQGQAAISHTPALMEMSGLAYLGHDPLGAALLDHKHTFKHVLRSLGIPTSPFVVCDPHAPGSSCDAAALARAFDGAPFPAVAKPVCGRASLDVFVCDNPAELSDALATLRDHDRGLIVIEPFLPGSEYCVTVAGPSRVQQDRAEALDAPLTLRPLQRTFGADERIFTSMDTRPINQGRFELLEDETAGGIVSEVREVAQSIYHGMSLASVVRIDLRADASGRPMVLEANPKPDLAPPRPDGTTSLTCAGLDLVGMSYRDLLLSLLLDRLRRIAAGRTTVSAESAAKLMGDVVYRSAE